MLRRTLYFILPSLFCMILAASLFADSGLLHTTYAAKDSHAHTKNIHIHTMKTPSHQVKTHTPSGTFYYHNGNVMQGGDTTYAIFWIPPTLSDGSTASYYSPPYESLIQRYFQDVGGSSLYSNNTQYYDDFAGHILKNSPFGGSFVDTSTPYPPFSDCADTVTPQNCLIDADIQAEVHHAMTVKGWTAGINHTFTVFTARGEGSCTDFTSGDCAFTSYCGYHSYFGSASKPIIYANIPYAGTASSGCNAIPGVPNDLDSDSTINIVSHEQMEMVTDPLGTDGASGWFDAALNEIGDLCAWQFGSLTVDGGQANVAWNGHYYIVQQEWSNSAYSCALTNNNQLLTGTLYLGSSDGALNAVNTSDGTLRWRFGVGGGDVLSRPVIGNHLLYITSQSGYLYAVNPTTALLTWGFPGVAGAPVLVGNTLYAGSNDANLYALNAVTGAKLWHYTTGGAINTSPAFYNGDVFVSSSDGYIYALNAKTGALIWQSATPYTNAGSVVAGDGKVYFLSHDVIDSTTTIYGLNAASGALAWSAAYSSVLTDPPTLASGVLYFGSTDSNVYAVNDANGAIMWNRGFSYSIFSAPVIAKGVVYFGSSGGFSCAINAKNAVVLWCDGTNYSYASPAVGNGAAYFASTNGTMYEVNATTGLQLWSSYLYTGTDSPMAVSFAGY